MCLAAQQRSHLPGHSARRLPWAAKKLALLLLLLVLSSCLPKPSDLAVGSTRIREIDGMVMVYVPAGRFTMGSQEAEIDQAVRLCSASRQSCNRDVFADEAPAHSVTLDAFWLDRTEVSNAQYRRCMAAGRCQPTSCPDDTTLSDDNQPAVCVSWEQAAAYCAWVGGRLPTEAEWEYAARGPQGRTYPWGDEFAPDKANFCDARCSYGWADPEASDGYTYTAPVGSFPAGASWCGALDMAGNAWEWVEDWYAPYTAAPQSNPLAETGSSGHVLRGGAWDMDAAYLRSAIRNWGVSTASSRVSGFRCALPATAGGRP